MGRTSATGPGGASFTVAGPDLVKSGFPAQHLGLAVTLDAAGGCGAKSSKSPVSGGWASYPRGSPARGQSFVPRRPIGHWARP